MTSFGNVSDVERLSVVVNDRALRTPRTGVGHYVYELLSHLGRLKGDPEYVPFFFTHVRDRSHLDRLLRPAPGRPIQGSRKPWMVRRMLQAGYESYFRAVCRVKRYRVYHEPNHIAMRFVGATVTTVHDLSVLRFPQWHPADRVRWYESGFKRTIRQSCHFIAVSEFTRQEMTELVGVAPERITVIHNAARKVFSPAGPGEYGPVLSALKIRQPFFLFAGTLEPRKNFDGLLSAYSRISASQRERFQLVAAGGIGWGASLDADDPRARAANLVLTGYLSDEQLRALYSACHAFVWPSLYEGFGLPPLECMACGRPVITSDRSSLPEVVGDAALTVDPKDGDALREAIVRLMEDEELAERLCAAGLERSGRFSWAESARRHAAVFRLAAQGA